MMIKDNGKICIIVPVYNVEKYLMRCLQSINKQSFHNYDLILVDDGSSDSSGRICDDYAKSDSRIHVIHKKNGGLSSARNAGIDWMFQNSNAAWVSFIDSDDWIHEQYFEILYNNALSAKSDISVCALQRTSGRESSVNLDNSLFEIYDTESFFCKHNGEYVVAFLKITRVELWETIRFPVGRLHEDEYTSPEVLFQRNSVVYIDAPLYYYFQNQDGIMHASDWKKRRVDLVYAFRHQLVICRKYKKNKAYKRAKKKLRIIQKDYYFDIIKHMPNLVAKKILGDNSYEKVKALIKK